MALQQRTFIKSYKQRLKRKFDEVRSEAKNVVHVIESIISNFHGKSELALLEDGENFFALYKEVNEELESFSENLFLVLTALTPSGDEGNIPLDRQKESDLEDTKVFNEESGSCSSINPHLDPSPSADSGIGIKIESTDTKVSHHPSLFSVDLTGNVQSVDSDNGTVAKPFSSSEEVIRVPVNNHHICESKSTNLIDGFTSQESFYYSVSSNDVTVGNDNEHESKCSNLNQYEHKLQQCFTKLSVNDNAPPSDDSVKAAECTAMEVTDSAKQKLPVIEPPLPVVIVDSYILAIVSHYENPSNFWMQLDDPHVETSISVKCPKNLPCSEFTVGSHCLAPFRHTGIYRRARILKLQTGAQLKVKAFFVDYGNTELICASELRALPPHLLKVPLQAINCCLDGVKPDGAQWSANAIQKFQEALEYSDMKVHVISRRKATYIVDLLVTLHTPDDVETLKMSQLLILYDLAIPAKVDDRKSNFHVEKSFSDASSDHKSNYNELSHCQQTDVKVIYEQNINSSCMKLSSIVGELPKSSTAEPMNVLASNVENLQTFSSSGSMPQYSDACDNIYTYNRNDMQDSCHSTSDKNDSLPELAACHQFDWNLNIPPAKLAFVTDNMMLAVPSCVVSPSEFYMNPCSENATGLDDLQEQMNLFYEKIEESRAVHITKENLKINMFCSCLFVQDMCWYRVKVLEIHYSTSGNLNDAKVLVQYVDYGNKCVIRVDSLRPLIEIFAMIPAFAVECCLSDILPLEAAETSDHPATLEWDQAVISEMKKLLLFEKCFTVQIVNSRILPCKRKVYAILLWDTQDSVDCLINILLINEGLARYQKGDFPTNAAVPNEVVSEPEAMKAGSKETVNLLGDWDPMTEEYNSVFNSYGVECNDIEMATCGYKAKDESYICKFYASGRPCFRGEDCPYQHIRPGVGEETRDQVEVYSFDRTVIPPSPLSYVIVQVSTVLSPGHFYVVFPYGTASINEISKSSHGENVIQKEYTLLSAAMDSHYSNEPFNENTAIALSCGNIVAAKSNFDNHWYRGRIIDVEDIAKPVELFYVDFGNREWVDRRNVREIRPEFLHVPFQALECVLSNIEPFGYENGREWSSKSRSVFQNQVERKMLIGHIDDMIGNLLYITLRMTTSSLVTTINDYLVQEGYGQYCSALLYQTSEHKAKPEKDLQLEVQPG